MHDADFAPDWLPLWGNMQHRCVKVAYAVRSVFRNAVRLRNMTSSEGNGLAVFSSVLALGVRGSQYIANESGKGDKKIWIVLGSFSGRKETKSGGKRKTQAHTKFIYMKRAYFSVLFYERLSMRKDDAENVLL